MRSIFAAISLLVFPSTQADPLCDAVCDFHAAFPGGGSIEAGSSVGFIFGEGGFINDGATTTGYADQQLVSYTSGSPLVFTSGGEVGLGAGGNIDAGDFTITSGGAASLKATGGNATLTLNDMTMTGGGSLAIEADEIVLAGTLSIGENTTVLLHAANSITLAGSIEAADGSMLFLSGGDVDSDNMSVDGCAIDTSSTATITSGQAGQVTLTTATGCSSIEQTLNLDPGAATAGTLSINGATGTLNLEDGTGVPTEITAGPLVLNEQTPAPDEEATTNPDAAGDSGAGSLSVLFAWVPVLLFLFRNACARRPGV